MNASISRVGIVGGGQMGAGIAEVCARTGLDTVACETDAFAARAARERVAVSLERAVQRGSGSAAGPRGLRLGRSGARCGREVGTAPPSGTARK